MIETVTRPAFVILSDAEVLARTSLNEISALTERATAATFYRDEMTPDQMAANRRIVDISAACCLEAAESPNQRLAAAFAHDRLAGYVIATRHAPDDLELDWLMVDPAQHGSGVSGLLMQAGMAWLGADQPIWLNVISYNARAIAFYEKFGFKVEPLATTPHVVPHSIMRRAGAA
ncbi:GNAT family N-acetyltransferase [Phenylobacterium sp.]|uniref:GNAT family N-acetyltransferase n=1 Tax=Phenylobacterium sp. TaxID=1871053 RepID=UPI00286A1084|nr:GNAT family N-acetyltransferase [Phenylobacterium sp.]